jgi:geranylgeranyl diphosphate/geranylgeranyl-bacteriochlorophyllide a reductase
VLDGYLRERAVKLGAQAVNGLVTKIELPQGENGRYKIHFSNFEGADKMGTPEVRQGRRP